MVEFCVTKMLQGVFILLVLFYAYAKFSTSWPF